MPKMKIDKIPNCLTFGLPLTKVSLDSEPSWRHITSGIDHHWDINSKSAGKKWINIVYRFVFEYQDNYFVIKLADNTLHWKPDRTKRKPYIEVKYDISTRVNYTNDTNSYRHINIIHQEHFRPTNDIPTEIEVSNKIRYKDISDSLLVSMINYSYQKAIDDGKLDKSILEFKKDIERIQMQFIDDVDIIKTLNPKRKESLIDNV